MRALPLIISAFAVLAGPAFAQDSAQHASAAVGGGSEVAGHLAASGVQTAVGVSAVPVSAVGAASAVGGSVVAGAGAGLSEAAGDSADFASGPLKVDDRVVVSPDAAPNVPYDAQKAKPR